MIRTKTLGGILVMTGLVALSYWASRSGSEPDAQPIPGLDTKLDYALHDFELRFYDEQGAPAGLLTAPMLANNAQTGVGEIHHPQFEVKEAGLLWHITAQSATVTPNREHIFLNGAVDMRRSSGPQQTELDIQTSDLLLEVSTQLASSEQQVRINEETATLEALGFRVNLKSGRFELLDQVNITYAIN